MSEKKNLVHFLKMKKEQEPEIKNKQKQQILKEKIPEEKPKKGDKEVKTKVVEDLIGVDKALLLSVDYDGKMKSAFCRLYDLKTRKINFWYDTTNHKPYLLTDLGLDVLNSEYPQIKRHKGFIKFQPIKKFDLITDQLKEMVKIITEDPLSVGGSKDSIREYIKDHSFEATILYHRSYLYDSQLIPGMLYLIKNNKLRPVNIEIPSDVKNELTEAFKNEKKEFQKELPKFLELFFTPIPEIRRIAFDIEVKTVSHRIPDPNTARQKVICISFVDSDNNKLIYLLKEHEITPEEKEGFKKLDGKIEFFSSEKDLIEKTFELINDYPIVITYNGDKFDIPYLHNRAKWFRINSGKIPFIKHRDSYSLTNGIHLDLYKLFFNRAIQVSAFGNSYKTVSLEAVSMALLKEGKIEHELEIHDLSYDKLAKYCLKDSELTFRLTSFDNNLVMKLLIILMRITKLPIEDISRSGISNWIKNLFYYEHRVRNFLIPNPNYLNEIKSNAATKAIIKGKKYMGAKVIDPIPGIHFNIVVLDFASLYPSIIKEWNLSYETVNCPHEDCKSNLIPNTPHWACTHRIGISALIIGLLRDMRVKYFKIKAKDKNISPEMRNLFKIVQASMKVIINASYGVFGSEIFPLYCLPMAESTSAIGRYAIEQTIKKVEEMGLRVVYGDSIIGNRCIPVLQNGWIDVIPIQELWNRCKSNIYYINRKEVKIPSSIYTFSKNGDWSRIKQIIRHKTNKKLYRINQKEGETICTEDHSLITEGYTCSRPSELGNKKILTINKIELPQKITPNFIDLYYLVKERDTTKSKMSNKFVYKWEADEKSIWIQMKNKRSKHKIFRYCNISDLCKLIGYHLADGIDTLLQERSQKSETYKKNNKNYEIINELKNILSNLEIVNKDISDNISNNTINTVDKYLWIAFFDSLCGIDKSQIHLPSFIYNIDIKFQKLLFEYYTYKKSRNINESNIEFYTPSLHLISGLCFLLKSWGITLSISFDDYKNIYKAYELKNEPNINSTPSIKVYNPPEKMEYVYDLSVADTEIFVDACGMLLLHNTDSVFIENPTKEQIDELIKWSNDYLGIELDVEKSFRFSVHSTRKKNYFGVYEDGSVDIKGLSGKKRNTPLFVQNAFKKMIDVISAVKKKEDFDNAKIEIKNIIKTVFKKLKNYEYTPEELAFKIAITKPIEKYTVLPQHVKAAKILHEKTGAEIGKGSIIYFLKTKDPAGVQPLELANVKDIDVEKYKETVESIFEQVLDALGINFDELKGKSTLDKWM
ncbi:MAG: DNA-directed DNA polymerase I [Candidatus Helarchaeota archaeon]